MTPSSSQPTDTSTPSSEDDVSATTSSSTSSTPASFSTLPNELRLQIIELACQSPLPSSPPSASVSTHSAFNSKPDPLLDLATTLNLLIVSTHFYHLAAPSLYRNVTLSRPSLLDTFLQLLIKRPQLGELVKSLRVGDKDKLPESWYPLKKRMIHLTAEGRPVPHTSSSCRPHVTYVVSSLRNEEGPPTWSPPGTEWPISPQQEANPRRIAIELALKIAQCCIGVDLAIRNSGFRSGRMSGARYLVGIIEVQAVLDLYILELQRLELSGLPAFPRLYLSGYPSEPTRLFDLDCNKKAFVISRKDILYHLARPRCVTDRFGHPLYPARLGIDVHRETRTVRPTATQSCAEDDPASLPRTATIPLTLDLLRSVLQHTTKLRSLSLSSFLEQAIRSPPFTPPTQLRSLSIGPAMARSSRFLYFGAFANLEVLRIRNLLNGHRDVLVLLETLPALKTLTLDWRSVGWICCEEACAP